jgi:predicted NAD/FAD-binding protein
MTEIRYVAIIGGGIGGLSAAHYIHGKRSHDGRAEYRCEIFEKARHLGGNAQTAYFDTPFQKRFADLGVNDFNLASYKLMGEVLREMEHAGFPVGKTLLNDSDCYYKLRGDPGEPLAITKEDLDHPTNETTRRIDEDRKKFESLADQVIHHSVYETMSVGEFLTLHAFSHEFRDLYMLPRINGMYFMGETVPEDMPIRGVMSYYHLQEGIGTGSAPERYCFENGASEWIEQFAAWLHRRGVKIHLGATTRVSAKPGARPRVTSSARTRDDWDAVVCAVPADEVQAVVTHGLPEPLPSMLTTFRYINSIAIAHQDEAVMPPRRDDWRTYNIRIFPPKARLLRPYTISYVETMHQGAKTPWGDVWFVTENPPFPIADHLILDMVEPTGKREKAVAYFRHNTITTESMRAQRHLPSLQGENSLYFTGGWTFGAGLHEEILHNSRRVSHKLLNIPTTDEATFLYRGPVREPAGDHGSAG